MPHATSDLQFQEQTELCTIPSIYPIYFVILSSKKAKINSNNLETKNMYAHTYFYKILPTNNMLHRIQPHCKPHSLNLVRTPNTTQQNNQNTGTNVLFPLHKHLFMLAYKAVFVKLHVVLMLHNQVVDKTAISAQLSEESMSYALDLFSLI